MRGAGILGISLHLWTQERRLSEEGEQLGNSHKKIVFLKKFGQNFVIWRAMTDQPFCGSASVSLCITFQWTGVATVSVNTLPDGKVVERANRSIKLDLQCS